MTDPDWTEVEGTVGKTVNFTVYDSDGVVENLSGYDESKIQLKVWDNDGDLKFEKDMSYLTDGVLGQLEAYIGPSDIARGDEGAYFFVIELEKEKTGKAEGERTETIFQTDLDEADNFWIGFTLTFALGTVNAGESQVISAYNKTNGEVTMASPFAGVPDAEDAFTITPGIVVPTLRGTLLITQGAPE